MRPWGHNVRRMELRGANVILTGGSKGLGPVIAEALAAKGARLALTARSADELNNVKAALESRRTDVVTIPADVTKKADRERLVTLAEEELGPTDILINGAGMQTILSLPDQTEKDVRAQIDLNLVALMLLTHRVLPGMLERKRGHIVNLASIAGMAIVPYETIYAATKHAVKGFTFGLHAELRGTGVGASIVSPGTVDDVGMFAKQLQPKSIGGSGTTAPKVAAAVIKAIETGRPEVVSMGFMGRSADVALAISPRFMQSMYLRNPAHRLIKRTAEVNAGAREKDEG
ncbi:MAG: SDR family NAD(P)-dependent oxidoreductase [Actinobacteria bacterium]|nr:SDR family NAD(P)-dependent oxidoreductase [Actinomycetota bacterium]